MVKSERNNASVCMRIADWKYIYPHIAHVSESFSVSESVAVFGCLCVAFHIVYTDTVSMFDPSVFSANICEPIHKHSLVDFSDYCVYTHTRTDSVQPRQSVAVKPVQLLLATKIRSSSHRHRHNIILGSDRIDRCVSATIR